MAEQDRQPALARMRGFAGRTELYPDRVRMVRDGVAAAMAEMLGTFRAEAETVIRLDRISAFEVYRPMFLPPLLVLHYAGSLPLTGRYWRDAFAENVHMCGFLDQRDVERFAEVLETALRTAATMRAAVAETRGTPAEEQPGDLLPLDVERG